MIEDNQKSLHSNFFKDFFDCQNRQKIDRK